MSSIFDWPGKSDSEGNEYPAVRHMLDVAACAERLIEGHVAFAGLTDAQRRALVLLVALHDVGKLSESFRALIRHGETGHPLHWQLSDFLLCGVLDEALSGLGADGDVRAELYAVVAGHHGRPPDRAGGKRSERRKRIRAVGSGEGAAREWVATLLELFPDATLDGVTLTEAKRISWALGGLTVAADWVGSNRDWFPFQPRCDDIVEALAKSRGQAERALNEAGLHPARPMLRAGASSVGLSEPDLRPMQQAACTVALGQGPQLAVLEDATGTGKTEAALILAHRMITAGKARGLFFALPTMATSDAIMERVEKVAPGLFETPPSAVLTHSRAGLSKALRELRGASSDNTPESDGTEWLTDNRRRSLLATISVGTVDQGLLGILPTRFSTLRLFGLVDRVMIVDEAHSYEPYMQRELEGLLRMQARLGGSAILMTATLPTVMRQGYVNAFQDGLDAAQTGIPGQHYPGLHLVDAGQVSSHVVGPLPESVRTVRVKRLRAADDAVELLKTAAAGGAACVWVRNAVDDAIAAAQALTREGVVTDVLHARFALIDRLRHEEVLMRRFGKEGAGREGRVLVATQVVEASLDLDFDVMVSDLAPIGSLIQRAGRLWRHMSARPENKRPVPGPTLNVLSPDPSAVAGEDWLNSVLDRGAWVYRLDDQWRTAKTLFDAGEIVAPAGLRSLIDAVHGDEAIDVPEIIVTEQLKAEGRAKAEAAIARANVVAPVSGYLSEVGTVANDAKFPTRLGEPQVTMVLARRDRNGLTPWAGEEESAISWALSEVSASRRRFERLLPDQDTDEIQEIKRAWPEWRRDLAVCVVDNGCAVNGGMLYDRTYGLRVRSSPPDSGDEPVSAS
ncbi:MAG: CRISPR-associated helicase Cas3' [Deltaproteobacteria bacterium]|nr:CRISPR-associated helicase Cas3' [Deltaproteobacteria bacterium]